MWFLAKLNRVKVKNDLEIPKSVNLSPFPSEVFTDLVSSQQQRNNTHLWMQRRVLFHTALLYHPAGMQMRKIFPETLLEKLDFKKNKQLKVILFAHVFSFFMWKMSSFSSCAASLCKLDNAFKQNCEILMFSLLSHLISFATLSIRIYPSCLLFPRVQPAVTPFEAVQRWSMLFFNFLPKSKVEKPQDKNNPSLPKETRRWLDREQNDGALQSRII